MLFFSIIGTAAAAATLPGSIELAVLTIAGVLPTRRHPPPIRSLRKMAVVIPAHNETHHITDCVKGILAADKPEAALTVVVVADNCTDATAALALDAGAAVIARTDTERRGKGYALERAFNELFEDPEMDAVLVVDADTAVESNFIRACEETLAAGADAVQCRYLVRNPSESQNARLMNAAFLAFNVLRPRARARLGLSVGIVGNGWGVSRRCMEAAPYCAHSLVEDLEYHIRLVRTGLKVQFVDHTAVHSDMPNARDAGASTQRARWEGGRFRMIREHVPRLLKEVMRGRFRLTEPMGELLLLPLSYHVVGLLVSLTTPFLPTRLYALGGLALVVAHIAAGLAVGGGTLEDFKALVGAPRYILWKAGMFQKIIRASQANHEWVRTRRSGNQI